MSPELNFEGQTVLVTGGTKGIGKGIAERFLELGANVAVCGRNEPESLAVSGENEAVFFAANVRDPESVNALVDAVVERFGGLNVMVNNAGGSPEVDAATVSPRFTGSIVDLNLTSVIHCAQAANRVMRANGGGSIINIASVSATRPSPGTAAYGAAKAGVLNLSRSLAVEWAPAVRVNAITAGLIRTEQSLDHYGNEEGIAHIASTVPMGRMGTPADIANACVFLASPLSSYVSGSEITLHGGGEWPAFYTAAKSLQN